MNLPNNFSYAELARGMDAAFVTVLSEHLEWVGQHPEKFPHSEHISQSQAAWLMAHDGFSELEQKFMERLYEWHSKWQQRFELEGTAKAIAKGAEEIKKSKNPKEKERLARALYLNTVHLMVGDAQKHLVTLNGRVDLLQEGIRKIWHKNCPADSYSKILPSIEGSFQNYEEKYFDDIRNSMPDMARREFLETIVANDDCNSILNLYYSKIFHYVSKISFYICKFYSKKWTLYARGFSSRQHSLPLG